MEKEDFVKYWVECALHDLSSMDSNFNADKYDWALFIGHIALEKILKALWVKRNESNYPVKTHNLIKIAVEAGLNLTEDEKLFLNRVTNFHLESRYPDYKMDFYKLCTKEFTLDNITRISEYFECIKKMI